MASATEEMENDHSPLDRPESIPAVFVEAWNRSDPDKLASVFDEDAEFVNVVGLWWHDRKAIRKAHAYGLERIFNDSTLRSSKTKIKYLADGIDFIHAKMALEGQTPSGGVEHPSERTNRYVPAQRRFELCGGPQYGHRSGNGNQYR